MPIQMLFFTLLIVGHIDKMQDEFVLHVEAELLLKCIAAALDRIVKKKWISVSKFKGH